MLRTGMMMGHRKHLEARYWEMNEQTVKQIILVRAIETADRDHTILSEDDRRIASHSALEGLSTAMSDPALATQTVPAQFMAIRAGLLVNRAKRRYPALEKLIEQAPYQVLGTVAVVGLAFIVGVAIDRVGDPHRVDLLSAPLLGILTWNMVVYLTMLVWSLLPRKPRIWSLAALMRAGRNRLLHTLPVGLHAALISFFVEWRFMSATLDAARIGRMLHLGAAVFAVGATLSLYLRGFLTQYAAGWESTFLDSTNLQSVLSFVFAPARAVFQLQAFTLADVEALRFRPDAAPGIPGSGARWVHLYAATLLLLVILPRLALAGLAHWRVRRLQQDFPISLEQPYFRQFTNQFSGVGSVLQVLPYSFSLDAARHQALVQVAGMLLGERVQITVESSADYGAETVASIGVQRNDDVTITAILFNLAATPETENHGAFLDQTLQQARMAGRQLLVLLDESGYSARLGKQAGAQARVTDRIALWQSFLQQYQLQATVVDLLEPQRYRAELATAGHFTGAA